MAISAVAGTGDITAHDVHGSAAQAAAIIELGHAVRDRLPGNKKEQRILAEGDDDRTALALFPIFLAHDARVVSRRNVKAEGIFIVNLDAVNADVDPTALFGFAGDDAIGRADITAAVELMPMRRRKNRHVNLVAGFDVFQDRAAREHARRYGPHFL
jgi:hypothetical protein